MSVETMKDIINYAAEQYGDQDAFRYKVKKEIHGKTYRQLKEDTESFSRSLDKLGLLDTYSALILPSIFIPLGTFILTQSFKSVSDDIIDAAKLDGCGLFRLLTKILLPMNTSGLVCVTLLSFLDGWNMVEQPIAYIKDFLRYPISVALAYVPPADPTLQLVCCIMVVLPPLFLFTYFNRELVEGIVLAEVK